MLRYWVKCIYTHLHAFASISGVFPLFSPLNILHTFFCLSALSLFPPCRRVSSSFPSSTAPPGARPSVFLPSCLPSACSPLLLPAVCAVAALPFALSPPLPLSPSGAPLKLPGGLLCVLPCVVWLLPSLVCCQAQNGVTVWADTPRIYPRPCLLLPICCRVFRCPFRCLFRGFRPSVRVCVLLPCVVRW